MDQRPHRSFPERSARPRPYFRLRPGARRRRQVSCRPGSDDRRDRRLFLLRRGRHSDTGRPEDSHQCLRYSGRRRRSEMRHDQYGAGRSLPGRRPARGDICHGASGRCRRPRLGHRPDRAAAAQSDPPQPNALHQRHGHHLRQRRIRSQHGSGHGDWPIGRITRPGAKRRWQRRAVSAASRCRNTSRPPPATQPNPRKSRSPTTRSSSGSAPSPWARATIRRSCS